MRYFIKLGYKGTAFHGWQYQPNAVAVQELVNKAFSTVLRKDIDVLGAGRTDTGVHAEQMYAHFDFDTPFDKNELIYKANAILPDAIVIHDILRVKDEAHARFDALRRSYEYRIYKGKNPFFIDLSWQIINKKLNSSKMNSAAEILLTYTDFKCFSRSNTDVKTYNCKIFNAEWKEEGEWLIFYISADRFLRNMVRAIVGTLVEIGTGKTTIDQLKEIIESKDRKNAGPSAPAQGLFLTEVVYPKTLFIDE